MAESRYSIRLAAQDAFSSTFRDFEDVSDDVRQAVRDQQKELRELNRAARDIDGYDRLQRKLEETSGELATARTEQARLAREMAEAENPSQRLTRAYDRAVAKVKTLESAERGHRNELGRVSRSLTDAGVDTNNLAEEQRRLERSIESANGALQSQRGRLEAVRDAQGRIDANRNARADLRGRAVETAALGYLASRPINQAMDVETAAAEYAKVANGVTPEQIQAMASANLRMSTERQFAAAQLSAVDLFRIQASAAQGGIATEEVMPFTRTAATMAAAFDMSADDAGDTLMAWRAGMGLNQERANLLADASNELGNTFNAQSGDIAEVLRRQGAVAMSSGFSELQTAALSAALLNGGASREVSATALKNMTGALTKGEAATGTQKDALSSLGFDAVDLASAMQSDAVGTTLQVIEALQAAPPERTSALVTQLFGEESKGAIMPLLANTDALRQAFALVADDQALVGSMAEEAAGLSDTSRTTWNRLTSSFGRLTAIVGTAMLPAFEAVANPLGDAVNLVADFAEENQGLVGVLAAGAAGLVALKTAALGLQFGKLMLGQGANYARLARARSSLNTRQAQTARAADGATRRLNMAMNMLGRGGAAGAAGRRARTAGRATGGAPRRATMPAANTRMAGMTFSPVAGAPPASAPAPARASQGWRARMGGLFQRGGASQGPTFAPAAGATPAAAPAAAGNAARGWRGSLSRVGDLANRAGNSRVARWGGRAAVPLMLLGGAAQAAHAAGEGDAEGVGSAVGGMAGGLGGAWAGAGAGAALGTMILPGVGTAVGGAAGGLIGGIAGSEAGQWIGEKAGGFWNWATGNDEEPRAALDPAAVNAAAHVGATPTPQIAPEAFVSAHQVAAASQGPQPPAQISPEALIAANRVASPEEAAREVTENTDNRTIAPSFDIKIESSGDPARDEALLDRLMERLRTELMPMLQGGGLDVRLDASLTDGGA
ncbi:MAG: phage tail tape measure protein [Cobetia sp.]|jgi:TP901 family phage tail tape measure protein|uniref:phage tail tape measure protein n=1 Tax=Cobetia sp. TaxID=1873876 RepID=UPI0032422FD1